MIIGKRNLQQCSSIFKFFLSISQAEVLLVRICIERDKLEKSSQFFYYTNEHRAQEADTKLLP
jgi:hypothetical protein